MDKNNLIKLFLLSLFITCKILSQDLVSEIESKLESNFNLPYSISTLVNVNRAIAFSDTSNYFFSKFSNYEITDPYGSLKDSYIFVAKRKSKSNSSGKLVGIYKDSNIKWISDTLIYKEGSVSTLYRTYDLNLDGNVEIIVTWDNDITMKNPKINPKTMWIFSWNGDTGYPINEIDVLSSKLLSSSAFKFIDYNGDGVLELIGQEEDENGEPEKIFWVWDGNKYVSSLPLEPTYINQRNAEATIYCTVNQEDKFLYQYVVKNEESSKRRIQDIHISTDDVEIVNFESNNTSWNFYPPKQNSSLSTVSWLTSGLQGYTPIDVGEIREGFAFYSTAMPSVQRYYILSEKIGIKGPESHIWDVLNNSTTGFIIAPKTLTLPIVASEFLDSLINYAITAYDIGWLEDEKTFNILMENLEEAKVQLSNSNYRQTIKLLNNFSKDVDKPKKKKLSSEASALLYYNAEYLISQLPTDALKMDSMSPTITVTKSKDLTLTVYGSDFSKKSDIYFHGKKKKTKFISENELKAEIKDKYFKKEGTYTVHVSEKKIGRTEELEFNVYKELPERLIPVLNCIEELEGKKNLAWFGYENYNDGIVFIDGKENEIKGGKKKKGSKGGKGGKGGDKYESIPPVIFLPGVHEKVFSVEYDDKKNLKWELLKEKAEVTENTPVCQ